MNLSDVLTFSVWWNLSIGCVHFNTNGQKANKTNPQMLSLNTVSFQSLFWLKGPRFFKLSSLLIIFIRKLNDFRLNVDREDNKLCASFCVMQIGPEVAVSYKHRIYPCPPPWFKGALRNFWTNSWNPPNDQTDTENCAFATVHVDELKTYPFPFKFQVKSYERW